MLQLLQGAPEGNREAMPTMEAGLVETDVDGTKAKDVLKQIHQRLLDAAKKQESGGGVQ